MIKLGAAWQMNPRWTLRAGINHGRNPITPADVTFNVLAPGVITTHYTAGFTYSLANNSELTTALMIAPRQTVTDPPLMDAMFGPGVAGNETIRMREFSIRLGWSKKF